MPGCLILSDSGPTKTQPSLWWGSFSTGGTTIRFSRIVLVQSCCNYKHQLFGPSNVECLSRGLRNVQRFSMFSLLREKRKVRGSFWGYLFSNSGDTGIEMVNIIKTKHSGPSVRQSCNRIPEQLALQSKRGICLINWKHFSELRSYPMHRSSPNCISAFTCWLKIKHLFSLFFLNLGLTSLCDFNSLKIRSILPCPTWTSKSVERSSLKR